MNSNNCNNVNKLYYGEFDSKPLLENSVEKYYFEDEEDNALIQDIQLLTEDAALKFWRKYFSENNKNTMQLTEQDWVCNVKWKNIGKWIEDFNHDYIERVANILKKAVAWDENTVIYFCSGYHDILKTKWFVFLKKWNKFLEYNDDGPILVAVNKKEAFSFVPMGSIQLGHRETKFR